MNPHVTTASLLAEGHGDLEEKTLANDRPSSLVEAVSGNQVVAVAQLLGPYFGRKKRSFLWLVSSTVTLH